MEATSELPHFARLRTFGRGGSVSILSAVEFRYAAVFLYPLPQFFIHLSIEVPTRYYRLEHRGPPLHFALWIRLQQRGGVLHGLSDTEAWHISYIAGEVLPLASVIKDSLAGVSMPPLSASAEFAFSDAYILPSSSDDFSERPLYDAQRRHLNRPLSPASKSKTRHLFRLFGRVGTALSRALSSTSTLPFIFGRQVRRPESAYAQAIVEKKSEPYGMSRPHARISFHIDNHHHFGHISNCGKQ